MIPTTRPPTTARATLVLLGSLGLLCAAPALDTGCSGRSRQNEILVAGAISLREALTEAGAAFERRHRGARVQFHFAASGTLATQIRRGAPVDVFVSASERHMRRVLAAGQADTARAQLLCENRLVLVAPRRDELRLRQFADLRRAGRIALGNPVSVPAGRYARATLEHLGLWRALSPRLVQGEHVRQVLDYVARGEVDAALVYATDAATRPQSIRVVAVAPRSSHPPIRYPIAPLRGARNPRLARAFVAFLRGPAGQAILARHGFLPPADRRAPRTPARRAAASGAPASRARAGRPSQP